MRRKSEKAKINEGFGKGSKEEYKSFIRTKDFGGSGTTCNAYDWKIGRTVELFSQTEYRVWLLLRWNDEVEDINEQYPLDIEITKEIAEKHGIKHPMYAGNTVHMTTDFLVTLKNGKKVAIYVKYSENDWKRSRRTAEKAFLEKYYWKEYKNTKFIIVSNNDINKILAKNIEMVTAYYDRRKVHDEISMLKHKIAVKELKVDMESSTLNYRELLKKYGGKL